MKSLRLMSQIVAKDKTNLLITEKNIYVKIKKFFFFAYN